MHSYIEEDLYLLFPKGYNKVAPSKVFKLIKSLYGLKQANRQWNKEFTIQLRNFSFTQSTVDHCLFTKGTGSSFVILLVYVDDVLIAGPDEEAIRISKISRLNIHYQRPRLCKVFFRTWISKIPFWNVPSPKEVYYGFNPRCWIT